MNLGLAFSGNNLEFYDYETGESESVSRLDSLVGFLKNADEIDKKSVLLCAWLKLQKVYLAEIERIISDECCKTSD